MRHKVQDMEIFIFIFKYIPILSDFFSFFLTTSEKCSKISLFSKYLGGAYSVFSVLNKFLVLERPGQVSGDEEAGGG